MNPNIKLNHLCSFPIIHFDTFTKNSIWWHSFVAEVKKHRRPRATDLWRTWKVLLVDTETGSEDEFDTYNCSFEAAFDECTQLYIQW